MKNSKLNNIKKKRAEEYNESFWYKRIGKCNPQRCGGACCRYSTATNNKEEEYHDIVKRQDAGNIHSIKRYKNKEIIINNFICPYMTIDCKCSLHGKKKQPYTCDVFPMHHTDCTYQAIKKFCGYRFIRIKNNKYKYKRKIKEIEETKE